MSRTPRSALTPSWARGEYSRPSMSKAAVSPTLAQEKVMEVSHFPPTRAMRATGLARSGSIVCRSRSPAVESTAIWSPPMKTVMSSANGIMMRRLAARSRLVAMSTVSTCRGRATSGLTPRTISLRLAMT